MFKNINKNGDLLPVAPVKKKRYEKNVQLFQILKFIKIEKLNKRIIKIYKSLKTFFSSN